MCISWGPSTWWKYDIYNILIKNFAKRSGKLPQDNLWSNIDKAGKCCLVQRVSYKFFRSKEATCPPSFNLLIVLVTKYNYLILFIPVDDCRASRCKLPADVIIWQFIGLLHLLFLFCNVLLNVLELLSRGQAKLIPHLFLFLDELILFW